MGFDPAAVTVAFTNADGTDAGGAQTVTLPAQGVVDLPGWRTDNDRRGARGRHAGGREPGRSRDPRVTRSREPGHRRHFPLRGTQVTARRALHDATWISRRRPPWPPRFWPHWGEHRLPRRTPPASRRRSATTSSRRRRRSRTRRARSRPYITHRFNQNVKDAGGGSLFGLDSGCVHRASGIEYVPVKNLAVQVYRVNNYADYEFALKATLLRPTAKLPLAVGLRGGLDWRTASYAPKETSWFGQAIVSYTIADRVTLAAAPAWVENTPVPEGRLERARDHAGQGHEVDRAHGRVRPEEGLRARLGRASGPSRSRSRSSTTASRCGWATRSRRRWTRCIGGDYNGGVTDNNVKIGFSLSRAWDLFPAAK